jgi:hypothetical protein
VTPPIRHLKRHFANRTECDDEDDRVFADGPADATCTACLMAYERRASEWHGELRERIDGRAKRDTDVDDPTPDKGPDDMSKGQP